MIALRRHAPPRTLVFVALVAPLLAGVPRSHAASTSSEDPTLAELVATSDGLFHGEVTGTSVRALDPGDGAPLYLTTVTLTGTPVDLGTGLAPAPAAGTLEVVFPGGFVDEDNGSFNSIAPPRHATRLGRRVVVFHRHEDDAYGGGPANVLVGARAGLFTAFVARDGRTIVQGRADRLALPHNRTLEAFAADARELARESPR